MKKLVFCLLIAAISAFALCGCGAADERLDEMIVGTPVIPESSPMVTPAVTPMPMPDTEDGVVKDGDGLIDDGDTGRTGTSDATTRPELMPGRTGTAKASPSPAVTAQP